MGAVAALLYAGLTIISPDFLVMDDPEKIIYTFYQARSSMIEIDPHPLSATLLLPHFLAL